MYPNSAKLLKYKAYLRRKFVRGEKERFEDISHLKLKDEVFEKRGRLLSELSKHQSRLELMKGRNPKIKL